MARLITVHRLALMAVFIALCMVTYTQGLDIVAPEETTATDEVEESPQERMRKRRERRLAASKAKADAEPQVKRVTSSGNRGTTINKDGVAVNTDDNDADSAAAADKHMQEAMARLPEHVRRMMDPDWMRDHIPSATPTPAPTAAPPAVEAAADGSDDGSHAPLVPVTKKEASPPKGPTDEHWTPPMPNIDHILRQAHEASERAMQAARDIEERVRAIREQHTRSHSLPPPEREDELEEAAVPDAGDSVSAEQEAPEADGGQ